MSTKRRIVQSLESEKSIRGGRELHLTYRLAVGHPVPAILLVPDRDTPVPAAVLVHGYSSRKEHVAEPVGKALLTKGIASLSLDLPLHGTRANPVQKQSMFDPVGVMKLWRQALEDVKLGLRYLAARPEVDADRIALLGYSMGSFLSIVIAADDPGVKAVILAAGGDLPDKTPFSALARMIADPMRAVRKLDGRPLLMVHGKRDRTVTPAQARRLFEAANEPKQILWYDAGHYLPAPAARAVAKWLGERFGEDETGG